MKEINIEVLKKFNQPGPRYTSYPTAPMFSPLFTAKDFEKEIIETNLPNEISPLSLYFHFPYCEKLCYFCGCNMLVTKNRGAIGKHRNALRFARRKS